MDLDREVEVGEERRVEAEVREGDAPAPHARGELVLVNPLKVRRQVLGRRGVKGGSSGAKRQGS